MATQALTSGARRRHLLNKGAKRRLEDVPDGCDAVRVGGLGLHTSKSHLEEFFRRHCLADGSGVTLRVQFGTFHLREAGELKISANNAVVSFDGPEAAVRESLFRARQLHRCRLLVEEEDEKSVTGNWDPSDNPILTVFYKTRNTARKGAPREFYKCVEKPKGKRQTRVGLGGSAPGLSASASASVSLPKAGEARGVRTSAPTKAKAEDLGKLLPLKKKSFRPNQRRKGGTPGVRSSGESSSSGRKADETVDEIFDSFGNYGASGSQSSSSAAMRKDQPQSLQPPAPPPPNPLPPRPHQRPDLRQSFQSPPPPSKPLPRQHEQRPDLPPKMKVEDSSRRVLNLPHWMTKQQHEIVDPKQREIGELREGGGAPRNCKADDDEPPSTDDKNRALVSTTSPSCSPSGAPPKPIRSRQKVIQRGGGWGDGVVGQRKSAAGLATPSKESSQASRPTRRPVQDTSQRRVSNLPSWMTSVSGSKIPSRHDSTCLRSAETTESAPTERPERACGVPVVIQHGGGWGDGVVGQRKSAAGLATPKKESSQASRPTRRPVQDTSQRRVSNLPSWMTSVSGSKIPSRHDSTCLRSAETTESAPTERRERACESNRTAIRIQARREICSDSGYLADELRTTEKRDRKRVQTLGSDMQESDNRELKRVKAEGERGFGPGGTDVSLEDASQPIVKTVQKAVYDASTFTADKVVLLEDGGETKAPQEKIDVDGPMMSIAAKRSTNEKARLSQQSGANRREAISRVQTNHGVSVNPVKKEAVETAAGSKGDSGEKSAGDASTFEPALPVVVSEKLYTATKMPPTRAYIVPPACTAHRKLCNLVFAEADAVHRQHFIRFFRCSQQAPCSFTMGMPEWESHSLFDVFQRRYSSRAVSVLPGKYPSSSGNTAQK